VLLYAQNCLFLQALYQYLMAIVEFWAVIVVLFYNMLKLLT